MVPVMRACSWSNHGGPARNARVSYLCRCDEKTRVNTCMRKYKLLVQALESCPSSDVCCSANLSTYTFSRGNPKSAGLAYMDSQKLDYIATMHGSPSVPK